MIRDLLSLLKTAIQILKIKRIQSRVLEINSIEELNKLFGWSEKGVLDRADIHDFNYDEDLNGRRIRDAEVLSTIMKNFKPQIAVEIGTSTGMATALMSVNSPSSKIYTVNIPPEEILSGEGGNHTTIALEHKKIGHIYKEKKLTNIHQILANTKTWKPDFQSIDLAFIDGCHDTEFVINDTKKLIKFMKPGSFILWHDFNPELMDKYAWIFDVGLGVDKLYQEGVLQKKMYHLKDSWIGIYRV